MLFRLKKCVPFTQMRQSVMFHTNNTTQLKMKTIYHRGEPKYSNIINPSLNVHRLLHSENQNSLPPLMFGYPKEWNIFEIVQFYFIFNMSIDPKFKSMDFMRGVLQAMTAISTALSMQDYEALNGMVKEKAIKILRHRVDRLTPRQRELLIFDKKSCSFFPHFIKLKRKIGSNDAVVQIGVLGVCAKSVLDMNSYVYFHYIFERMYKNGVGSEWIVRLVNHTTVQ
ncbi:uncharacterized protein LOC132908087 [Bombus pascuorum]|uniref:uncharacterized protein LOC132908087 n=1 Tax=Bombus pascuorum TaxID=65598 RepID=UPI0021242C56|nr:uncharacterized protein LOC132908087 [Bombus pascuorum]XP_060817706.1 uncharacterized protein LOC132908087 [Bombus pascuorum]